MYNNMQTTIAISKSFKKKFRKAKLTVQAQLIPPKAMTDEHFIKWLMLRNAAESPFSREYKIGDKCVDCAEIIENDKHYCNYG